MIQSKVEIIGGVPTLTVNGKPIAGMAYMTYELANNRYGEFAKSGYKLFSAPMRFSNMPANEATQFSPRTMGIYDDIYEGGKPKYWVIDETFEKILSVCPDAYIFPRVNVSLPGKWEEDHPDECNDFGFTPHKRACFASDLWAEETKRLLKDFIAYIESSPYRDNIIGYQLSGGQTEEWLAFDMNASIGKRSREGFVKYRAETGAEDTEAEYYHYLSEVVAKRVCEFARTAKECVKERLVVGSFYGYTLECPERTSGHHALDTFLACKDVDFICSPTSYAGYRRVGQDQGNMLPLDSVKLHGKIYFQECDHRTHLTRPPNDMPAYNTWIWQPTEKEPTKEILKLLFARALTHGHALWWFDMWGGWFADEEYMDIMRRAKEIADASLQKSRKSTAPVAMFIDERAFDGLTAEDIGSLIVARDNRCVLFGTTGVPYDIFLATDFEKVAKNYKAVVMLVPCETPALIKNRALSKEYGLPVIELNEYNINMGAEALAALFKEKGVAPYTNKRAVVYACESYVFLHTSEAGVYEFTVDGRTEFTDAFTGEKCVLLSLLSTKRINLSILTFLRISTVCFRIPITNISKRSGIAVPKQRKTDSLSV